MFKLTIPLAPVTKKNSQQIVRNPKTGRYFLTQSKKYKDYERQVLDILRLELPQGFETINEPVEVVEKFYMPTHRIVDLTNLEAALDDILVRGGVIADDNSNIVKSHDGSRVLYDKENPRTELEIVRYEMTYSFSVAEATKYGLHEAVLLEIIRGMIARNWALGECYHDGKYWVRTSVRELHTLHDFLTARQIRNALDNLRDEGVLIAENHNENKYDRTMWYRISEE